MDPNETHRIMLRKAIDILDKLDNDDEPNSDDVSELANAVESLHNWLKDGGALPAVWGERK